MEGEMMVQTEVEAYEQMTREQQKRYIKMLIEDTKAHINNALQDEKSKYYESAATHVRNFKANIKSLESLLSPVIFRDVCEELL